MSRRTRRWNAYSRRLLAAAALFGVALLACAAARAEGRIAIVEQFGTLYLPLHVIRDQRLIEKHGKAAGLEIDVQWHRLSGGAAINDGLLSGSIDVAAAGLGPFFILWDRTGGAVKITGALGAQPNFFLTNREDIRSLADIRPEHRIATPAALVSIQARLLQMAAEQEFGVGHHARLDKNVATLPHPDATAALLSGSAEIVAHISNSPYQEQALADPKIHKLWSSYDIVGGPLTPTITYATVKFRRENPKTYRAFIDAFEEATAWIAANTDAAAETFIRVTRSPLTHAFVAAQLRDPQVRITTVPSRTFVIAEFMRRTGAIRRDAQSWKDYTFEELHDRHGS